MLTHPQIWRAIDALAARHGMSPSGLAKIAGLDPTTFNKSKRGTASGKLRWPSTESIAKVLAATGASLEDFVALVSETSGRAGRLRMVPLIGMAQAGTHGYFDDAGFPAGSGWEDIAFPDIADEHCYALEITGDSMLPLYRDGDRIVVSRNEQVRRGDRVVVKTKDGEVMAKILARQTANLVELHSLNPAHPPRQIDMKDVDWIARIIWASQ